MVKKIILCAIGIALYIGIGNARIIDFKARKDELRAFKEAISGKPVVIKYSAEWCGPCKMMKPIFEAVSHEFAQVTFIELDTDHHKKIAQEQHIQSLPTFAYYKDGKEMHRTTGTTTAALIKQNIKKYLVQEAPSKITPPASIPAVKKEASLQELTDRIELLEKKVSVLEAKAADLA